ncbi:MAG: hypothetical protein Q9192_003478 [Flavoplaca navasiana]
MVLLCTVSSAFADNYHPLTKHVAGHRRRRDPTAPAMELDLILNPTARGSPVPSVHPPSHSGHPSPGGAHEIFARSNNGFSAHPDGVQSDPDDSDGASTLFGDSDGNSSEEQDAEDLRSSKDRQASPKRWVAPRGRKKAKAALEASILGGAVIHALPPSEFQHPPCCEMTRDQVAARMKEIHGFDAKEDQVETVWEVGCAQKDRILIAKTGFGKSLLFETVPLLDPQRPGIALVVTPLKSISWQEEIKVDALPGARAAVYDGETKSQRLRYEIAAGYYTHVFISPELLLSVDFHKDVINADTFRERLRLFAIDELHCVEDWKNFRVQYSCVGVVKSRLPPVPFLGLTATLIPRLEKIKGNGVYFEGPASMDAGIWLPILRSILDPFNLFADGHDKKRILEEFQKPDTNLRILVATEIFGFGAHVPNIDRIVNEQSPDGIHSLAQHLGRTAREIDQGQFFLMAEPYTSTTQLASKTVRRSGGTTTTSSRGIRETSVIDASTPGAKLDAQDAARRAKVEPELLEFINAPECHRRTLLKNLGDTTYAGDRRLPELCCSKCNDGLIPPFRPLPSKDTGSAFVDAMKAKLSKWRSDKAFEITPRGFPVIHNLVLVDEILDKLAAIDPRDLLGGTPSLSDRLRRWRYSEPYVEDIAQICREVIDCPDETIGHIHRATIGRQNRTTQSIHIPTEGEFAAAERVGRRNRWLISVGRQDLIPKEKPTPKPRKKRATSTRRQPGTPGPSQTLSQHLYLDSSQPYSSQDTTDDLQFLPQVQTPPKTAPSYGGTPIWENTNVDRPPLASTDGNRQTPTARQRGKRRA